MEAIDGGAGNNYGIAMDGEELELELELDEQQQVVYTGVRSKLLLLDEDDEDGGGDDGHAHVEHGNDAEGPRDLDDFGGEVFFFLFCFFFFPSFFSPSLFSSSHSSPLLLLLLLPSLP